MIIDEMNFEVELYNLNLKSKLERQTWRIEKQLLRMQICLRICNKMLLTSQHRLLRNSTLKRILLHSLRKSLTRNTIQHGIALSAETLVLTSPMKQSISFTSILVK